MFGTLYIARLDSQGRRVCALKVSWLEFAQEYSVTLKPNGPNVVLFNIFKTAVVTPRLAIWP